MAELQELERASLHAVVLSTGAASILAAHCKGKHAGTGAVPQGGPGPHGEHQKCGMYGSCHDAERQSLSLHKNTSIQTTGIFLSKFTWNIKWLLKAKKDLCHITGYLTDFQVQYKPS